MNKNSPWTDVVVIGSILVAGIGAAWVTNDPVEPDAAVGYVSQPVEYPVDIPGCKTVEPPQDTVFYGYATTGMVDYDNPAYPWLTSSKANAMSLAIQDALPADVEIVVGSRGPFSGEPFVFQPVPDMDMSEFDPGTTADATVLRNGVAGSVRVNVSRLYDGPEPCRAGRLDARETLSDGTIVDTYNGWNEYDGKRVYTNSVRLYAVDGTRIRASSSDQDDDFVPTGMIPLAMEELRTIVMLDDLKWSTRVPDGYPLLPISCNRAGFSDGQFTAATVRRINAALDGFWQAIDQPVVLDRPLGSMRIASSGTANACGAVMAGDGTLTVSVADAGYSMPSSEMDVLRLPDGSEFRSSAAGSGGWSLDGQPITDVTLVKPSGTLVLVSMKGGTVDEVLLQSIALAVSEVIS
ncbi:hypothetical protein C5142_13415 [Rhodococcus sp. BGS-1C]|uniref:hypothetical protein n=1 Tax=unclassified Rhodococcus (in: high G+C Gram-positive bacteria) TaxID=192944 RepID=UPI0019D2100B|nr:hypothetical protein [Rhodococcus sp. KRD197]